MKKASKKAPEKKVQAEAPKKSKKVSIDEMECAHHSKKMAKQAEQDSVRSKMKKRNPEKVQKGRAHGNAAGRATSDN